MTSMTSLKDKWQSEARQDEREKIAQWVNEKMIGDVESDTGFNAEELSLWPHLIRTNTYSKE